MRSMLAPFESALRHPFCDTGLGIGARHDAFVVSRSLALTAPTATACDGCSGRRWWEVPMMRATGTLYDLIAGRRRTVPPSSYIPAAEAMCVILASGIVLAPAMGLV